MTWEYHDIICINKGHHTSEKHLRPQDVSNLHHKSRSQKHIIICVPLTTNYAKKSFTLITYFWIWSMIISTKVVQTRNESDIWRYPNFKTSAQSWKTFLNLQEIIIIHQLDHSSFLPWHSDSFMSIDSE
jgi:hypothetical protein